jgi:hypothetical protein
LNRIAQVLVEALMDWFRHLKAESFLRWYLRFTCLGGAIAGSLVPAWEEHWTVWGVVASTSFIVLIGYAYWKVLPLEAFLAKRIALRLNRFDREH